MANADKQIDLIVFDMGHVFVRFSWEAVCEGFCERTQLSQNELQTVLKQVSELGYEHGKVSTTEFLTAFNHQLKTPLSEAEFTKLWNATFEEDEEMSKLMQSLKRQLPLYLLSNTNELHYNYLQENFNVARHFEEILLSYKLGYIKPQPEIYQVIFERSGLAPSNCLFIDDLLPNIEAAQKLGIETILFQGIADLKQRLPQFGISIL